jgi:hypothetical protein
MGIPELIILVIAVIFTLACTVSARRPALKPPKQKG